MALVKEYLKLTDEWKKEYGENTLILMQVGAFFEVYGLQDKQGIISGSNIEDYSSFCDLATPIKHVKIDEKEVIMAGFRDYQLEKYLCKLQNQGYTTLVYTQDVQAPNTTRSLSGIYSPGTFFSSDSQSLTNNTICIWIQSTNKIIHIGISNVDVYTGKTSIFEFSNEFHHNPSTYDELERFISIYNPSEVIIVSSLEEHLINDIIGFVGIQCNSIHKIFLDDTTKIAKTAKNCEKQNYQIELIKRLFPQENESIFFNNFYNFVLATQSFCFLIDYVYQHNPNLVSKLDVPIFENCSQRLILANHSLKQLNIVDDQNYKGRLSSVLKFLNNCVTIMGKRHLSYKLLNPINDVVSLNNSYNITEYLLKDKKWSTYRTDMTGIFDIEKFRRKLIISKITPKDFYTMYHTLLRVDKIFTKAKKDKTLMKYIQLFVKNDVSDVCRELVTIIETNLNIDMCKNIDTMTFDLAQSEEVDIFVKKGASEEVDKALATCFDTHDKLQCIQKGLGDVISPFEKKNAKAPVTIRETATLGTSLIATSRRFMLLKKAIEKRTDEQNVLNLEYTSKYSNTIETLKLDLRTLQFSQLNPQHKNVTIQNEQIKSICSDIKNSKGILIDKLDIFFNTFISEFLTHQHKLDCIISFATQIDFLQCLCYNANNYNYCKPTLIECEKSFVKANGLRHCLIEHLQTQELYVANDVELGKNMNGMLLYGTNAVGKTSFIKSLGISVIMAQAGMYVPCQSFVYSPYQYIFTRILGNDNIFKGLSTFAVEMSELRTILKLANKNSLILGDELCSGTESDSARSIFIAGLEQLHREKCSFVFATHFHEITRYDEVISLKNMCMKHMTVLYDKAKNSLIYDRKLKDGPGNNMYGLEVCKSLDLPSNFLTRAHDIRMKYNPETQNTLTLKPSHFNSKKIKGLCELCKNEIGTEVHHLQHQSKANKDGFINSFHKNHEANLLTVCEACHHKFHNADQQHKKVKTSKGYQITEC